MQKMTIAVYGTLKRGFRNHRHFCGSSIYVENAVVAGTLYNPGWRFPVLCVPEESVIAFSSGALALDAGMQASASPVWAGSGGEVHVELLDFENPDEDMPSIDHLERVPNLYRRALVPAKAASGRILAAWVYMMPRPPEGAKAIPSGVWRHRRRVLHQADYN